MNMITSKNACVEPPRTTPYFISVCLAKSSTLSIGVTIRSTVRKAARKKKKDSTPNDKGIFNKFTDPNWQYMMRRESWRNTTKH